MENINRAIKMEFLNYKYFLANNKKEIEGSHYLLLNQKEMLRSLNICCSSFWRFLFIIIPPFWSKEYVLKYGINSYLNIGAIGKYLEKNVSKNILQHHVTPGCDANSFSYITGKINPF